MRRSDPSCARLVGRIFNGVILGDSELEGPLREQREHTKAIERALGCIVAHVCHRNGKPIRDYNTG